MATLYVSYLGGADLNVASSPLGTETITTSTSSAKGSGNATRSARVVVVHSDTAHYVNVGPSASVTASAANGIYVPANAEREISIRPGEEVAAVTLV